MKTYRPLFWVTLVFAAGIVAASVFHCSPWIPLAACFFFVFGAFFFRRKLWLRNAFWLCAAFFLGAFCYAHKLELPSNHIVRFVQQKRGEELLVKGVIVSDVSVNEGERGVRTTLTMNTFEACAASQCQPVQGAVLVSLFGATEFRFGDAIEVKGKLHRPFNTETRKHLSYRDYLERRGVFLAVTVKKSSPVLLLEHGRGNAVFGLALASQKACIDVYNRYLSSGESGLMNALMLGDRSRIPDYVRDLFVRTGTAHIIAISGMNITMIAFGFFLILKMLPVGRRAQMALTISGVIFYTLMAGGGSPVVRAAVMSTIFLLSFMIEREQDALNTLAASALLILVFDPAQVFDIGFQLTYACVLALIVWAPVLLRPLKVQGFCRNPMAWFLVESLTISLAATLASSGIIAYYFELLTPAALMTNLPAVPLVAVVTAFGAGLLVAAWAVPFLAWPFALCLKVSLNLMVWTLWLGAKIPGGCLSTGEVALGGVLGYYAALLIGFWAAGKYAQAIVAEAQQASSSD
ncbi:MAG: ComEC/Rec2 family competence protein [Candidatus Omnitrophica bacterium]|nr:ComEC/Rec2 family competence protein [Candidatus Omnitrophota bacterium]